MRKLLTQNFSKRTNAQITINAIYNSTGVIYLANPAWRTEKRNLANDLRDKIELKTKELRELEGKIAQLKRTLEEVEISELPILLYACCYKDDDSGRLDYDHFYYLPDLQMEKPDRVTRCIYVKGENHLRPNTLDLRTAFKNCGFPNEIVSFAPDFWNVRQNNQSNVDKAVKNLVSVIDHLFTCEEIESWQHLRERLVAYYLPDTTN